METKLVKIGIANRIIFNILAIIADYYFEDADQSSSLLFKEESQFKTFLRWDSIFYYKIMENDFQYPQQHAFLPGLPLIMKLFSAFLTPQIMIIAVLLMNNILFVVSSVLLYRITLSAYNNQKFAFVSALIFIFNPASVFYSAIYGESLFAFLFFYGTYNLYKRNLTDIVQKNTDSIAQYMFFVILLCYLRPTGVFTLIVVGYPILLIFFESVFAKQWIKTSKYLLAGIICLTLGLFPQLSLQVHGEILYCLDNPQKPEWCFPGIGLYNYVSNKYWNVGFLTYYEVKKAFFIYWGLHTFIIILIGLIKFISKRFKNNFSKDQNIKIDALALKTFIQYLIAVGFAHTQSSTRFFSTNIFFYWILADLVLSKNKFVVYYLIYFNIAGCIMFSNFLPWT